MSRNLFSISTFMDIDLLSKMVRELILDRDEVLLPGVGVFVAEFVPSSFSDRGYTINPPYRKLSFRQRQSSDNSSLIEFYSKENEVSVETATDIVTEFLAGMKEVLQQKKTLVLPGLGRLRATKENAFFFIADEDLDIWPAGLGLEPLSLKTHLETEEEVSAALSGLKGIIESPAERPVAEAEEAMGATGNAAVGGTPVSPEATAAIEAPSGTTEDKGDEEAPAETADTAEPKEEPGDSETTSGTEESGGEESANEATDAVKPEEPTIEGQAGPVEGKIEEITGEEENVETKKKRSIGRITLIVVLIVVLAAVLAFGVFILLAHTCPDFIDRLLYNKEDIEFLRNLQGRPR